MEKLEKIESKCPFKLFLRVRPQKNGNTTLLDFYNPKDSKHMHIISPKDSFVKDNVIHLTCRHIRKDVSKETLNMNTFFLQKVRRYGFKYFSNKGNCV